MTNFGLFLVFLFASSLFDILVAETCQLSNLKSYVYQDLVPINASNYWIFALQNDCTLQIWSNGSAPLEYNYNNSINYNNSDDGTLKFTEKNSTTKCKNGQISTSSSKNTVSIQVFVQNNETSEIFIKTFTPSELETTKIAELNSTFILDKNNQSMQPLSCYSMPKNIEHSIQSFIVCIFYNSNESHLLSGIYDSDTGNFSNFNPIHGLQNQSEILMDLFSSKVAVSFYRDDFNQKLTVYLCNENGGFLVLENRALSSSFTLTVKKQTKMQKSYQNFIHISSFEPFSIFFEAFTSKLCTSNICKRYLFPFLTEPFPICFDERKSVNNTFFENVGIIFNNFQLKSDTLNPYANSGSIFKSHGAVILTGILLITTIFLTILLTFCVLGIAQCLKSANNEEEEENDGNEIEVAESVQENIVAEQPSQIISQSQIDESDSTSGARTIVIVESFTAAYHEEQEEEEPSFKPKNFSFYDKE